ncbi:MAG: S8 family serine peptidase [Xanthomonadales bacterium]|nr:S8 family serine peptidase [Xanthomonadales bacterium]
MKSFKKQLIPVLASLSVLTAGGVFAQDIPIDSSIGVNPQADELSVLISQDNHYGATAHPLAPGIIVKYKDNPQDLTSNRGSPKKSMDRASTLSKDLGIKLKFKRKMSGGEDVLSFAKGKRMSRVEVQQIAETINDRSDVEYAEVDALMVHYLVPNDTRYNEQWHYTNSAGGMNLPGAWDTTMGSSVTVAVIDTGYRPHADLAANVVGQYDMISDPTIANDGSGRDSNAQDPGDWVATDECGTNPAQDSSWHGTHVAGTVAALTDNGSGVAGVAGDVNLVPIRVLGKCGGLTSDITDAIRWAAGLNVGGVPNNPNPADVINMSLGSPSPGACSNSYQNAIADATAQGAVVVVAAGNDNSSSGYPPANCNNTISVAAGGQDNSRAYYSNFGSTVDITGPGGDGCNPFTDAEPTSLSDCEGGVFQDATMILSTYNSGSQGPGSDSFGFQQGTSMAAPHIAGLAALIRSVDSSLTPAEVKQVIQDTADSFASVPDHQCTTAICGAGYANATAAIDSLISNPPPPGNGVLENGVALTGISGASGSETFYTMVVPAGATDLQFALAGGSGDADLYVRFGSAPTTGSWDCRPFISGNNETCSISNVQAGVYHVMLRGYSSYSGTGLTGSYTEPSGGQSSFFQNGSNVAIPDNNNTGITSNILVNRSGNAGTIEIKFDIVHTWRGDLVVDIIAPNGATANLHARTNSNDSGDNLSRTVNLNAASVGAAGTWRLRVKDLANADTGYIDNWSIEFQ